MNEEAKAEAERFLHAGEKQNAIQYLQDRFQIPTSDAIILVEALERELQFRDKSIEQERPEPPPGELHGQLREQVSELLNSRRKLDAVKLVRKELRLNLREALLTVERVAREIDPNYTSSDATGCMRSGARGLGIFLMTASILLLTGAAILFYFQYESISNSERVTGTVTKMNTLETGESAPVVSYQWQGSQKVYESKFYQSPPGYEEGESIAMFVNRDDPQDITFDTFADRWGLIVGLALPGVVLLAISIVFIHFARRKF